jgi:hypothetical protein
MSVNIELKTKTERHKMQNYLNAVNILQKMMKRRRKKNSFPVF